MILNKSVTVQPNRISLNNDYFGKSANVGILCCIIHHIGEFVLKKNLIFSLSCY